MLRAMGVLGFLWFAIVGFVAGWLAKLVVPGDEGLNWWQTGLLGIVGSIVGGALWSLATGNGLDLEPSGFIGSIIGAVVVLLAYNLITRRQLTSG